MYNSEELFLSEKLFCVYTRYQYLLGNDWVWNLSKEMCNIV